MEMREGIGKERGIRRWGEYSEPQAAHVLDVDYATLKRWRMAKKVPCVIKGNSVSYLGQQLIDIIIFGNDALGIYAPALEDAKWHDMKSGNTASETSGSPSVEKPGTEPGTTTTTDKPGALASALRILS
jgi:hypothetical protein